MNNSMMQVDSCARMCKNAEMVNGKMMCTLEGDECEEDGCREEED